MVGLILYGLGYGIFDSPVSALAMSNAPEGSEGSTAGLVSTMEEIGGTLGVVIFELVFTAVAGQIDFSSTDPAVIAKAMDGFHACFILGAAFCVMALVVIYMAKPRRA
jgi:MFS family permease